MKTQLFLTSDEVGILRSFGLSKPADVIDCYRRTKHPLLENIYLKTIGALYQIA